MKFEIDVPESEAVNFALALGDLAESFGIAKITETTYAAEAEPEVLLPGVVVRLPNGILYRVFSVDVTGALVLDIASH